LELEVAVDGTRVGFLLFADRLVLDPIDGVDDVLIEGKIVDWADGFLVVYVEDIVEGGTEDFLDGITVVALKEGKANLLLMSDFDKR